MTGNIRILDPDDQTQLEAFLRRHADSSMMMLSNLRMVGLVDEGRPYHGTYYAACDGVEITGVAALYWSGAVIVQASYSHDEIARAIAAKAPRAVTGILGPIEQARRMRASLGMAARKCMLDSEEDLYALALDRLAVPAALAQDKLVSRRARATEIDQIIDWRREFMIESLDAPDNESTAKSAAGLIQRLQDEDINWVLERDGELVAYATYGARLPDAVQIGSVWTPKELRGRGYGRAVVAGALLAARQSGVSRAVLFTDRSNIASRAAYRALGFEVVGDYSLILFAEDTK